MPPYKELYFRLFNQVSKTIEDLQKIQQACEALYINPDPDPPTEKEADPTGETAD